MTEIFLHEKITAAAAARVAEEFKAAAGGEVLLRIHSPGGNVWDGLKIASAIREHDGRVVARIDGVAFSMAANLLLDVDEVEMHPDGHIMFHETRVGAVGGQAADLRRTAETMESINRALVARLVGVLGETPEAVAQKLAGEIWMTGEEAAALGVVDRLLPARAMAAHFDLAGFQRVPAALQDDQDLRNNVDPAPEAVTKGADREKRTPDDHGEQTVFILHRGP